MTHHPEAAARLLTKLRRFAADRLSLRAGVENVFDARRQDVLDRPLPGRSVHAAVSSWW